MSDVTPMKTRTEPTPYSISPTTCKPSYLHIDNRYPPLNLQINQYARIDLLKNALPIHKHFINHILKDIPHLYTSITGRFETTDFIPDPEELQELHIAKLRSLWKDSIDVIKYIIDYELNNYADKEKKLLLFLLRHPFGYLHATTDNSVYILDKIKMDDKLRGKDGKLVEESTVENVELEEMKKIYSDSLRYVLGVIVFILLFIFILGEYSKTT